MGTGQSLHVLDHAVVIATIVLFVAVGVSFARRQTSKDKYFTGGRSLPAWAVGMSVLATSISSVTFLAYPGEGFASNWILLVQGLMVPLVLIVLIWFIVPLYRHAIGISAYEYFEKRFGSIARLYASFGFVLAHFSKMGTVFFLMGLALSEMMNLNPYLVIFVLGFVITLITFLGGIEAVIWLDVIQGFMLMGGGLICLAVLLTVPEGGPVAVLKTAVAHGKIGFGPYDVDFTRLTFIVMALNGIFHTIQKYGTDQTVIQRYLTVKSDRDGIKAGLMGALLCVPVWTVFMLIGSLLYSYYTITQISIPDGTRPDAVFPLFILNELPVGVTGLILAGLIAAAISSLDSDLNCLSAVAVEDYYIRMRPNSTDVERLRMGRIAVAVSGLAAVFVACLYVQTKDETVLGIVFTLYAIFSGGIAGLFLLGLFSRRANKEGLYVGMGVCILFTAWALLTSTPIKIGGESRLLLDFGAYNFPHHKFMLGVYSHIILLVVGYVASLFFSRNQVPEHLTIYAWLKAVDVPLIPRHRPHPANHRDKTRIRDESLPKG